MAEIRAFEADDESAVAQLMRRNQLEPFHEQGFLHRTLIDTPWRDPEIDSLVAIDDGRIVGFIAAQPRRLRFEERQIRAVCCSHLVVDEAARTSATGVLLLRRVLAGPQELTFSDSATPVVARLWRALGGHIDHIRTLDWMLVLNPGRWATSVAAALARRQRLWREFLPVTAVPVQAAGRRVLARAFPEPDGDVDSRAADADAVAAITGPVTRRLSLCAAHDEPYLAFVFGSLQPRGLEVRIVSRGGRPIGWFAYLLRRGRVSRLAHLAAPEADVPAVMGDLLAHVRESGGAGLAGRCEPHLAGALRARAAVLGFGRTSLVNARDAELRTALASSSSLLSQLDGEWFLV